MFYPLPTQYPAGFKNSSNIPSSILSSKGAELLPHIGFASGAAQAGIWSDCTVAGIDNTHKSINFLIQKIIPIRNTKIYILGSDLNNNGRFVNHMQAANAVTFSLGNGRALSIDKKSVFNNEQAVLRNKIACKFRYFND